MKKFTAWERFQSFASELISSRLEINTGVEADKAACDFAASVASAYRLSTSKVTLSDINGSSRLRSYVKVKAETKKIVSRNQGSIM
jgi:hypothetical protein